VDSLKLANGIKTVMTLHHMHCIGACMLKLHVKDGKVQKITSQGDITRQGSDEHAVPENILSFMELRSE
jgi:nitrate reductase alpha subunit